MSKADDKVNYLVKVDVTDEKLYDGITFKTATNDVELYLQKNVLPALVVRIVYHTLHHHHTYCTYLSFSINSLHYTS
jgi:hypothetical protein